MARAFVAWLGRLMLIGLAIGASACGDEVEVARTQLTLRVTADESLHDDTSELRATLFVRSASDGRWTRRSEVRLLRPVLQFPVDIPILPSRASDENADVEVILEAYKEADVVLQTRAVGSFLANIRRMMSVQLTRCTGTPVCPNGPDCHGSECQVCRGASCERAGVAPASEDDIGDPRDPVPGFDGGSEVGQQDERGPTSTQIDAGGAPMLDAAAPPSASDTPDASEPTPRVCPENHTCKAPYPCVPTSLGYTCRGQMADWPMPDALKTDVPTAKFKPDYEIRARTIFDKVTKLEWQSGMPTTYPGCTGRFSASGLVGQACTREEAKLYCENLDHDGRGWRLPTRIELSSLFDSNGRLVGLDLQVFGDGSPVRRFVSASTGANGPGLTWTVDFDKTESLLTSAPQGAVRCVRGGAEPPFATPLDRYEVRDGLVKDRATTLVWQQGYSPMYLNDGLESVQYCESLGFRVPTLNELMTLVDPTREQPAIDPIAFPNMPKQAEFLAIGRGATYGHVISFWQGSFPPTGIRGHVRCVRDE